MLTKIIKAILQANPDVQVVFGANEGLAIDLINSARELCNSTEELGRTMVAIGYDSGA